MIDQHPFAQLEPRTEAGRRFAELLEGHVATFRRRADAHDRASTFPGENIDELRQSGGLAAFVPAELGGLGLDSVHDWACGLERLGRGDASTAIALNMHLGISRNLAGAWHSARARGDEEAEQRNQGLLRAIAAGGLVICATATEAGTDFLRPKTTATSIGEGWRIDGRKIFVTMSPVANLLVLNLCVKGDDGDRLGFAFVPVDTPGLHPQDDWDALGMRASGSQSVVFDDCRVPAGSVQTVGPWGRWTPGVLMGRTLGNLTLVAVFLGIAERARELAVESATTQSKPKHDGPIAAAPGVQHLLGEIDIALAGAAGVLAHTTERLDRFLSGPEGRDPTLDGAHACMRDYQCAKWIVNHGAIDIVSRAMDVTGGSAYTSKNELSRLYRDVRAGPFMQPFSPTEAREYVGRIALDRAPDG